MGVCSYKQMLIRVDKYMHLYFVSKEKQRAAAAPQVSSTKPVAKTITTMLGEILINPFVDVLCLDHCTGNQSICRYTLLL